MNTYTVIGLVDDDGDLTVAAVIAGEHEAFESPDGYAVIVQAPDATAAIPAAVDAYDQAVARRVDEQIAQYHAYAATKEN